jgi:hypothetical protein
MSRRITTCPKKLKRVPMSTVESPVTQAAEVAVNSASTHYTVPAECAIGSRQRNEPTRIVTNRATASTTGGETLRARAA